MQSNGLFTFCVLLFIRLLLFTGAEEELRALQASITSLTAQCAAQATALAAKQKAVEDLQNYVAKMEENLEVSNQLQVQVC